MKMRFCLLFGLVGAFSAPCSAQEKLGELIDSGAKKLSAEEMRTLVVGANLTGPGAKNTTSDVDLLPDGTAKGFVYAGGRGYRFQGTYKIMDDGKICLHYEFVNTFPPYEACVAYYQAGQQYYLAYSDTDREAQVVKRVVKR